MSAIRRWGSAVVMAALLMVGSAVGASPAQAAGCGVSGGTLWCGNSGNAPIRDMPSIQYPTSNVIDHLYTTYSWFDCWSEGEYHSGGNYTWYHTQGDQYGRYGWVAAAYVYTSSSFDANPSAYGLRKCQYRW